VSIPPVLRHLDDLTPHVIPPVETVKLACLAGPADGTSTSVFFEVWEPGGAQPDNSHPDSAEIFVFLSGHGIAYSDEYSVDVGPGDVLILPAGSVHRIENTSISERMYTVTIMADDDGALPGGFAQLVAAGPPALWDDVDEAALRSTKYR
jgi:mannose-6-phosphate isomerase-like protein (cupin superfamily)